MTLGVTISMDERSTARKRLSCEIMLVRDTTGWNGECIVLVSMHLYQMEFVCYHASRCSFISLPYFIQKHSVDERLALPALAESRPHLDL